MMGEVMLMEGMGVGIFVDAFVEVDVHVIFGVSVGLGFEVEGMGVVSDVIFME